MVSDKEQLIFTSSVKQPFKNTNTSNEFDQKK